MLIHPIAPDRGTRPRTIPSHTQALAAFDTGPGAHFWHQAHCGNYVSQADRLIDPFVKQAE